MKKVIVNRETVLGSGTTTYVYTPEGGSENPQAIADLMRKLWESDCNTFMDEINERYINEDEAVIETRSRTISYEVLSVNEVA